MTPVYFHRWLIFVSAFELKSLHTTHALCGRNHFSSSKNYFVCSINLNVGLLIRWRHSYVANPTHWALPTTIAMYVNIFHIHTTSRHHWKQQHFICKFLCDVSHSVSLAFTQADNRLCWRAIENKNKPKKTSTKHATGCSKIIACNKSAGYFQLTSVFCFSQFTIHNTNLIIFSFFLASIYSLLDKSHWVATLQWLFADITLKLNTGRTMSYPFVSIYRFSCCSARFIWISNAIALAMKLTIDYFVIYMVDRAFNTILLPFSYCQLFRCRFEMNRVNRLAN